VLQTNPNIQALSIVTAHLQAATYTKPPQVTPPADVDNATFTETSPASATDDGDMTDDDTNNDPDWVSGQTPGGPQRVSRLRSKV